MKQMRLSDVARMTAGTLIGNDANVKGVSIDTRKILPDEMFIALEGEHVDGHDFVNDLYGKVAGALVSSETQSDVPQVVVDDTKMALAEWAMAWRKQFTQPVIGLTGSNGKTTVKEMLAAILGLQGNVLATAGNFNNDIGMPLTLLRIRDEHDYAVIEMGANHFGEIDFLADIASPDIALLNNAGPAHLEGFGDVEGVSRAKGEIFNGLSANGIAIINADDDYAEYWLGLVEDKQVIQFGLDNNRDKNIDVQGEYFGNGELLITLHNGEQQPVQLPLLGKHNALNALAATAVTTALGVDLLTIKKGLESLKAVPGRLAMIAGVNGSQILDDTYNANPASAHAAIKVLAEALGKRILVLGDMAELGSDADSLHAEMGVKAKLAGIEKMYCLGSHSAKACEKFGQAENVFSSLDELVNRLKTEIEIDSENENSVTLLVKGSRSAGMERIVQMLANKHEAIIEKTRDD